MELQDYQLVLRTIAFSSYVSQLAEEVLKLLPMGNRALLWPFPHLWETEPTSGPSPTYGKQSSSGPSPYSKITSLPIVRVTHLIPWLLLSGSGLRT